MNEKGENCLASVVDKLHFVKEHAEIMKMIIVMSEKQKVSNIYKTMPTHLVAKSMIFEFFHFMMPSKESINFLLFCLGLPIGYGSIFLNWLFWKAQKILSKLIN